MSGARRSASDDLLRRRFVFCLRCVGCLWFAATCSGDAAERKSVEGWSWDRIRAWAENKEGKGVTGSGEGATMGKGDVANAKLKAEDAAAPGADKLVSSTSSWKPRYKGERRKAPDLVNEVYLRALNHFNPQLEEAHRQKEFKKCWEFYLRMNIPDKALYYLNEMRMDTKRWAIERNSGWLAGNIWKTDMLVEKRMSEQNRELFFNEWKAACETFIADADQDYYIREKTKRDLKDSEPYYQQDGPNLSETLKNLETSGDSDPEALWNMCLRFSKSRPPNPLHHIVTLYKLREWFPDSPHVVSGEVQFSIIKVLYESRYEYEFAAAEADVMCNNMKECKSVKSGDALWHAALSHQAFGEALAARKAVAEKTTAMKALAEKKWAEQALAEFETALTQYSTVQQKYPKHSSNRVHTSEEGGRTHTYTYCQNHIQETKNSMDEVRNRLAVQK